MLALERRASGAPLAPRPELQGSDSHVVVGEAGDWAIAIFGSAAELKAADDGWGAADFRF